MGGLCVASGWLSQFFISFFSILPVGGLCVASGWLSQFFISFFFYSASGWLSQFFSRFFFYSACGWLVRSQWGFRRFFLVLSILPVGGFLVASGWLRLVLS